MKQRGHNQQAFCSVAAPDGDFVSIYRTMSIFRRHRRLRLLFQPDCEARGINFHRQACNSSKPSTNSMLLTDRGPGMGRGNDKRQQILNQLLIAMRTASMRGMKSSPWQPGTGPPYFPSAPPVWCRTICVRNVQRDCMTPLGGEPNRNIESVVHVQFFGSRPESTLIFPRGKSWFSKNVARRFPVIVR